MPENRLEVQQTQKLSQSLQTVIHLLSLDLDGLSNEMQKAIQENPALEYIPPAKSAQDYAMAVKTRFRGGRGGEMPSIEVQPDRNSTLKELEAQLRLSGLDQTTQRAAVSILHLLTPRGYFVQEMDEFAAEAGISKETAKRALAAVQSLEPPGIGARDVEECLELQLRAREDTDPLCYELVRLYLLEISKGNLRLIAQETGATPAHIKRCVETIKTLTPAPCSLREEEVRYVMPEFSVEAGESDQIIIQFHNDYYPVVRMDETFRRFSETLTGEEKDYARSMMNNASQMIYAIETRQTTMEKVAKIIVREQRAFFLGHYDLLPLSVNDAAKEIGVHVSTLYRAIQNKYLYCSRGTYPLSFFFQKEVSGGESAARAKEIIRQICRENGKVSDRVIAEMLESKGIKLSRRTVAKYRMQMEIDSSFSRDDGDRAGD